MTGIVVQYHAPLDEEGGGGLFSVYAMYDSEDAWLEHQDCLDYMLDNFSYYLGQSGMLPSGRYVDDVIEANCTVDEGAIPAGAVVADMRGEKLQQEPKFFAWLQ